MENFIKENSTNYANKLTLSERCSVNDTLTFIGKRWLMTILYEISLSNDQFSSLRKSLTGISDHILASRINSLFGQGLITKQEIENTVPSQIIYRVSAKGKHLLKLVEGLNKWSLHYLRVQSNKQVR